MWINITGKTFFLINPRLLFSPINLPLKTIRGKIIENLTKE